MDSALDLFFKNAVFTRANPRRALAVVFGSLWKSRYRW